jgi:hypothetical protein
MANAWVLSALWGDLAQIATLLVVWLRMATALSELVIGTVARLVIGAASCRLALGFNAIESGKAVLIFVGACVGVFSVEPLLTPWLSKIRRARR